MKFLGCNLEVKEVSESGSFEGLASVYGNRDLGDDIVEPGAFKEFVKTRDGSIRILDNHNMRMPIGKGILTDTHVGLAIKGQLLLSVAAARNAYELMKAGIADGLSIGYDVLPGGSEMDPTSNVRRLRALKLWEVSVTPFPMNQAALVQSVKAIERATTVREIEELLRDATTLSRSQAKKFAGEIYKTIGQRDVDEAEQHDSETLDQMLGFLKRFQIST